MDNSESRITSGTVGAWVTGVNGEGEFDGFNVTRLNQPGGVEEALLDETGCWPNPLYVISTIGRNLSCHL